MRALFTVYPAIAHLYPIVPYAWALQNAGHEVRVASHASFADAIAATGLTPVALGDPGADQPRMREDARQPPTPAQVHAYTEAMGLDPVEAEHWIAFYQWNLNPASDYVRADLPDAPDLLEFARAWRPDLVLWDLVFPAGAVAARVVGAAHGRLLGSNLDYFGYSLDRLAQHHDAVRRAGLAENPLADLVRPLANRYRVEVDEELLVGQFTIDPLPPGLSLPTSARKVAVRKIPYAGGEVFQEWLYGKPRQPRIALSLGESTRRFIAGDWGRTSKVFEAVSDLDVEVIATLNPLQLSEVGRVPGNVRVIEWVPLTQLVPTCSALVHHGGMGTFISAVAAKVPQLVCDTDDSLLFRPAGADQDTGTYRPSEEQGWTHPPKNLLATPCATYVAEHGAGVRLNHRAQSVDDIRKEIVRVLTEASFADGAAAIHETWRNTPSPNDIVPTLEELTLEGK
jgi:UDP:flavonoid glycosyltransferase YjiC (YdhE family)